MSKIISSAMTVIINGSLKFCEIIVPEKILPYNQLEYIQSTGTQYIDTFFGNSGTDYFVAGDDISAQSLNTLGITSAETIEENTKMLNSMGGGII